MSAKTMRAPSLSTDDAVEKNEKAGTITSSPGPTPAAIKDSNKASDPDATPIPYLTERASAISRSAFDTAAPRIKSCESTTRINASDSSLPIRRV